jgi:hypothetical protein
MAESVFHRQEPLQKDQKLLDAIKTHLPELEQLLAEMGYEYEDKMYRLYYQSFKVYELQYLTTQALDVFQNIAHTIDQPLSPWFTEITAQGIRVHFEREHNKDWLVHTRPLVEAFLHAKYFVEMMVKYGSELDTVPLLLPSGWAAILVLYNQR